MGCRRTAPPESLVRLRRRADGGLAVGPGPGRGAWLCRGSPSCVDQAQRRGAFGRALRADVVPAAVEGLRRLVESTAPSGEGGAHVCEDGGSGRSAGPSPNEEEGL